MGSVAVIKFQNMSWQKDVLMSLMPPYFNLQSLDVSGYDEYMEGVKLEEMASLDPPTAKVSAWECT